MSSRGRPSVTDLLRPGRRRSGSRIRAAGAPAGAAVLAGAAAVGVGLRARRGSGRREVRQAVTVHKPVEEVSAFWRDLANIPRLVPQLQGVEVLDEARFRWTAAAPLGEEVSWEAQVVADEPGRRITWVSRQAQVPNEGEVLLAPAPGEWGTEVRVTLSYDPPAGAAGAAFGRVVGQEPGQQVRDALRRLKSVLECGEVVRIEGQPAARGSLQQRVTQALDRRARSGGLGGGTA